MAVKELFQVFGDLCAFKFQSEERLEAVAGGEVLAGQEAEFAAG